MFRREYLSSVVNVLTNSVKISDQTIADFLVLNLPQIHEKIGQYLGLANFSSHWNPVTHWLPKDVLKQDLFDV